MLCRAKFFSSTQSCYCPFHSKNESTTIHNDAEIQNLLAIPSTKLVSMVAVCRYCFILGENCCLVLNSRLFWKNTEWEFRQQGLPGYLSIPADLIEQIGGLNFAFLSISALSMPIWARKIFRGNSVFQRSNLHLAWLFRMPCSPFENHERICFWALCISKPFSLSKIQKPFWGQRG